MRCCPAAPSYRRAPVGLLRRVAAVRLLCGAGSNAAQPLFACAALLCVRVVMEWDAGGREKENEMLAAGDRGAGSG